MCSLTSPAVRVNCILALCFSKITNTSIEKLLEIEEKHKQLPLILPLDPNSLQQILAPDKAQEDLDNLMFKYTAEDAVSIGIFVSVGKYASYPVHIATNLFQEGYQDKNEVESFIK